MKILIMCDLFDESIGSQENILAKYFQKHGHRVAIMTSTYESVFDFIANRHDNSKPARSYTIGELKVFRLPFRMNILHKLRSYRGARQVIEETSPDMIFMLDIMPDILEVARYKKKNPYVRFVIDYHADYSNSGKNWLSLKILHGVIRKAFLYKALPFLDAIYPVTPGSGDFLNEVYGLPRNRMELLPLGADMDVGIEIARNEEGRALRSAMGIAPEAKVIITGGKFARLKRTELLIEAVRRMADHPLELIVVGAANIGEEEYAATLQAAAGDDPRIRFVGWLDNAELFRFMDMADLAVFPASQSSLWVQAVSMGLPLVVGNFGAQDTSYMNAHDNIIELPRDEIRVDRLVEVIYALVSDPQRLAAMAAGARQTFKEVLDWDMLVGKVTGQSAPAAADAARSERSCPTS